MKTIVLGLVLMYSSFGFAADFCFVWQDRAAGVGVLGQDYNVMVAECTNGFKHDTAPWSIFKTVTLATAKQQMDVVMNQNGFKKLADLGQYYTIYSNEPLTYQTLCLQLDEPFEEPAIPCIGTGLKADLTQNLSIEQVFASDGFTRVAKFGYKGEYVEVPSGTLYSK